MGRKKQKNTSLDTYKGGKVWRKSSHKMLDIEKIDYYINNDLPLDEYYDSVKLYSYEWKSGSKHYNLNSEMKKKRDKENGNENV